MVLYGFPHKLLVKLASFFLKAKSLMLLFIPFKAAIVLIFPDDKYLRIL